MPRFFTLVCVVLCVTPRANADFITTFSDGEFVLANYELRNQHWGPNTTSFSRETSGGKDGAWLQTTQMTGGANAQGGTLNALFIFNKAFVIDPTLVGSITNIAFTMDMRTVYAQYGGSTNIRLVAEQDGRVFGTGYLSPAPTPTYSNWTTFSKTGLQLNQLREFTNPYGNNRFPTNPWPEFFGGPTLSSLQSNAPIRFGFLTDVGAAMGGQTMSMGFDNLRISITHTTAVPEPSSLLSATLGLLGLAGYAGWRRERSCEVS